jgi:hypothetical protein
VPLTPTGLAATGGVVPGPPRVYTVALTWNYSAGAAVYKLYRIGGTTPVTLSVANSGVGLQSVTDNATLAPLTAYCYAISAIDVNGNESLPSTQVCTATPP